MPPASSPATAPARAGLVGAPRRSAKRKMARGPMPISGMKVRQATLLVPINFADHSLCCRTRSSIIAARAMSTGAAARYGAALSQPSSGHDTERATTNALTASMIMTTNLNKNRGVSAAAAKSDLGPSITKKTTAASAIARPAAPHHTVKSDTAGRFVSAAKALMRSSVSISVSRKPRGQRSQAAMEGYSNCRLLHSENLGCLADRAPLEGNCGHH
jgi:hypothetical protein